MNIHVREAATSVGPSKKSTKKATSKTINIESRSTSGRDNKAVAQTARSFYDTGDYTGPFSDEEQNPLVYPLGEKDDMVHAPSPEPKLWPPMRTIASKIAPITVTAANAPVKTGDEVTNQLFRDLMTVRNEV